MEAYGGHSTEHIPRLWVDKDSEGMVAEEDVALVSSLRSASKSPLVFFRLS